MDWTIEIWRFFAYLASLSAVVRFAVGPIYRRVSQLEIEQRKNPKRAVADCVSLMDKCPIQAKIVMICGTLEEIKADTKEIRRDVQGHIKYHLKGGE